MLSLNANAELPFAEEITEVSVLLPGRQALGLEQAAHARGLTAAQMLRRLIQDFLGDSQRPAPNADSPFAQRWA